MEEFTLVYDSGRLESIMAGSNRSKQAGMMAGAKAERSRVNHKQGAEIQLKVAGELNFTEPSHREVLPPAAPPYTSPSSATTWGPRVQMLASKGAGIPCSNHHTAFLVCVCCTFVMCVIMCGVCPHVPTQGVG